MLTNDRHAYRQTFFVTWQKYQQKCVLEPLEAQLIRIILMHPEYHSLLEKENAYQDQEFSLEENPFLHMSLHLALHEQIRTNRPEGITEIYHRLTQQEPHHDCEHRIMTCLANIMWQAEQSGKIPCEQDYLLQLNILCNRSWG